jgi:hypothetical protein
LSYPHVSGPYYLVDLDQRTKTLIAAMRPDSDIWTESLLAEHCGFTLMPGLGNPLVIDARTGRVVFSQPWNSERAVWVHAPPRPSSHD